MSKTKLGPSTFLFPKPTVLVGAIVNGKHCQNRRLVRLLR